MFQLFTVLNFVFQLLLIPTTTRTNFVATAFVFRRVEQHHRTKPLPFSICESSSGRSCSQRRRCQDCDAVATYFPCQSYSRRRIRHVSSLSFDDSLLLLAATTRDETTAIDSNTKNETTVSMGYTKKKRKAPLSTSSSNPSTDTSSSSSKKPRRVNSNVRAIMDLLLSRYPSTSTQGTDNNNKIKVDGNNDWTKTRNYVYHTCDSLSIEQVRDVIHHLDTIVDNPKETTKYILQTTPRILRRSVTNSIQPTTEFLINLWGEDLFQLAIQKNPNVLLSQGLGYGNGPEKTEIEEYLYCVLVQKTKTNKKKNNQNNDSAAAAAKDDKLIQKLQKSAPYLFVSTLKQIQDVMEYLTSLLQPQPAEVPTSTNGNEKTNKRTKKPTTTTITDGKLRTLLTKMVTTHPQLFQLSVEHNLQPRVKYLMDSCCFDQSDISTLLSKSSCSGASILGLSVNDNLRPTINYISNNILQLKQNNTDDEEVEYEQEPDPSILRKVVLAHPQLLGLSLKNLQSKVSYFNAIDKLASIDEKGTTTKIIKLSAAAQPSSLASRVAIRAPAVYSLSLRENIIPTIEFLSNIWGTSVPTVYWNDDQTDGGHEMTITLPQQQRHAQPTTAEEQTIESSFSSNMRIASNKVSSYKKNGKVKQRGATTSAGSASLASLLSEYPSILTLSLVGNIQPTMNFYNRTGYTALTTDWELIPNKGTVSLIRGRYIAASLYNRLLPRYHYCYSKGALVAQPPTASPSSSSSSTTTDTTPASTSSSDTTKNNKVEETESPPGSSPSSAFAIPPLHLMVSATDEGFCEAHGFDIKDFASFKDEAIPRLKFSSQFDTWLKTGRPIEV